MLARDVRGFPTRLSEVVTGRLLRLGVDERLVDSEAVAMAPVVIAKTCDRSVLGTMNDFAKVIPFYLDSQFWDESSLEVVEDRLAETPCRVTRRFADVIFPYKKARELIEEKWGGSGNPGLKSKHG